MLTDDSSDSLLKAYGCTMRSIEASLDATWAHTLCATNSIILYFITLISNAVFLMVNFVYLKGLGLKAVTANLMG